MLEEIRNLIRKLENQIESKIKSIKKLENDYDDLLYLKKQLNSAAERHRQICRRQRAALNDPVLESSRCMQMFRSGMRDIINNNRTENLSDRLTAAVGAMGRKMSHISQDIDDEESAVQRFRHELDSCRAKLQSLTGGDN